VYTPHLDLIKDSAQKRGFRWWASWYLRASYQLMWGFFVTAAGSEMLLRDRFGGVHGPWRDIVGLATFITTLWMLWALWPRDTESKAERQGAGILLLCALGVGVLAWQREHAWAVAGTGIELAALMAWLAKLHRRSFIIAAVGWGISGLAVFLLPWPNGHRYHLVFVLGGFATSLQGGIALARDLIALRRQSKDIAADSAKLSAQ
jgi:hypothetical protein